MDNWWSNRPDIEWVPHDGLRNVGYTPGRPSILAARTYVPEGKLYPRVSVIVEFREGGIKLTACVKWRSESYWDSCPIPLPLVDDAIKMLTKAKEEVLR
jgi:hypothetical protein